MKGGWSVLGTAAGVVLASLTATPASAVEVAIACGGVGDELEACRIGTATWAKETGNSVVLVTIPNESTARLAMYQQVLAGGGSIIDVFQVDVIWPALLAYHFIDLKPYTKGAEKEHFPALVANDTVDGKLVAMPWYIDGGLLYYRKDLLDKYGVSVPTTWDDLISSAKKIQDGERNAGNSKFWGYLFQGKAYEGLTCDALEWIDSFGGGTFFDADGRVSINNPSTIRALDTWAGTIDKVSPKAALGFAEEDSRTAFQAGNAAFLRNWPYVYRVANAPDSPVRGKYGVAPLPKGSPGGKHSSTLGGWQLAVSKYSKNPAAAASLVMYLTSAAEQKRRAIASSYNPTIPSVYKDDAVKEASPFMSSLYDVFIDAVARPSQMTGPKYNKISSEVWSAVHLVLSKQKSTDKAVADLDASLKQIMQ